MTGEFSVEIEFRKEKLGFRVQETVLEKKIDIEADCDKSEQKDVVSAAEAGVSSAESDMKMGMEQVQVIDTGGDQAVPKNFQSDFVISKQRMNACLTHEETDSVRKASKIAKLLDKKLVVEPSNDAKEATEVSDNPDDKSSMEFEKTKKNSDVNKLLVHMDDIDQTLQEPSAQTIKIEDKKCDRPCELVVTEIYDKDLLFHGLVQCAKVNKINDITLKGLSYSEQLNILMTSKRPLTLTFIGNNYLKSRFAHTSAYCSILKELVAQEKNDVQSVFYELMKGTAVGKELESPERDHSTTIRELLSNRERLITLLQNVQLNED